MLRGDGCDFGRQGDGRFSDERCIAGTGAAVSGDEAGCAALGSGGGTGMVRGNGVGCGNGGGIGPCLGNGGGIGMVRDNDVGFGRQCVGAGCTALLGCSAATCGRGCVAARTLWLHASLDDGDACTTASSCAAAVIRLGAARDARADSDAPTYCSASVEQYVLTVETMGV